jgi:uncharacterized membrane protein
VTGGRRLRESVRSGFWALPAAFVVVALLLALGLVALDRRLQDGAVGGLTFGAGPDGAREVLSAITTSMITFTGLVFSITIVVLQLTSSQFSPRVLRTFLRDRVTQASLGTFVATFVYAVLVLRTVDGRDDDRFVPAVATTAGVVLLLVSVGVFVAYIHHVATAIQVSSVIGAIGEETRRSLERRYPADATVPPPGPLPETVAAVLPAARSGVVTRVDEARLVRAAQDAGAVLRLVVPLGGYVPEGAPLIEVLGGSTGAAPGALAAVRQARDRDLHSDVAFGLRQLVDIAERALSPGINDPTTAVQALDELHDLLRRLAVRPLRTGVHRDEAGAVRLVAPAETMASFLDLALLEIEQYGRDSRQVRERVRALLDDLLDAARPEHRPAVLHARRRQPAT